ncbi:PLD nuclease N-terminal domain-containing protein [Dictyobacter arantiisoli]|uniref:Cardiolipin synthase N-terminal domain-containing protein n=1 Tax=Dictyobacter arantiisoli TaxID=2014874 RepID=A0A5A5TFU6_9CHLR|nr:PLD nuclease N-terminal domain-containing protein [Dictyobacter arantiisoli]GCF09859.1 hypothetical protein KDI_34230 [Dictyobacter arantiisoli]
MRNAGLGMGIFLGFYCLFGIVAILATVFWIWMLIDCIKNEPSDSNDKIVWIIIIVFTHVIGAIIYYFMRRRPRSRLPQNYNQPPLTSR